MQRRSFAGLLATTTALAACDSLPWLGGSDSSPPLPGTRIPVILASDGPIVDPRVQAVPVTVPPAIELAAWPQAGGVPSHAVGNIAGTGGLTRAWSASIGAGGSSGSPLLGAPIVGGGTLFAIDPDGDVTALDASTGRQLWGRSAYTSTPDRLAGGGLAFVDGKLLVTLFHGEVVAMAAGDGSELWRHGLRTPLRAAPSVAGDRLLVTTADNQLYALTTEAGDVIWRHQGLFEPAGILGGSPPAVAEGIVVVAYSSGEVFGLQLDTGRQIWSEAVLRPRRVLALDTISDIAGAPVIDRGSVMVAGGGGEMVAFDLGRGTRLWDVDLTSLETPWVAGDFVYVVTQRGELVCLLREAGRIRWVTSIATVLPPDDVEPGIAWSGPVMVGGSLIAAGSTGEVLAFAPATGELVARQPAGGAVRQSPIAAGGTIFVLTEGGQIVAFR